MYRFKWPYKWVTRIITPINEVITLLTTGRDPVSIFARTFRIYVYFLAVLRFLSRHAYIYIYILEPSFRKQQKTPPEKPTKPPPGGQNTTYYTEVMSLPENFRHVWIGDVVFFSRQNIASMYGIFTYIWLIYMVNAGKYTSPMDGRGMYTSMYGIFTYQHQKKTGVRKIETLLGW